MKIYTTTTGTRGGRPAVKGDDMMTVTEISYKGKSIGMLEVFALGKDGSDGVRVFWTEDEARRQAKGGPYGLYAPVRLIDTEDEEKGETKNATA